MTEPVAYGQGTLDPGIRSRFLTGVNGLTMHILEAGHEHRDRPLVLLLHGFPELAYSWRKVMPGLADAGYHVVAPDQRGYGRTTGWSADYDGELRTFGMLNLATDILALVNALGYRSAGAVVGHDFGSPVAAWCALTRPDVFRSAVMMSAPWGGPPALPSSTARTAASSMPAATIHAQLAALPRPRKHYHWYYSTREANADMWHAPQGVHDFLRAYYHFKSADWKGNRPFKLAGWTADELAKMPTYYIMDRDQGMAEAVAPEMPSAAQIAACGWLTEDELRVYSTEYQRLGFQGGLQWYRCRTDPSQTRELLLFSGRTIDVPAAFIGGSSDWGVYQKPGDFESMRSGSCSNLVGCHLVDGAGHWVQQEQAETVSGLLIDFLRRHAPSSP